MKKFSLELYFQASVEKLYQQCRKNCGKKINFDPQINFLKRG